MTTPHVSVFVGVCVWVFHSSVPHLNPFGQTCKMIFMVLQVFKSKLYEHIIKIMYHTERESFGLFGFAEIGPSHAEQIQSKFILKVNKLWRPEIFAFVQFKNAIYGRPLAFVELSTEIGWIMCRLNQQCKLNHADPCSWNSTCKYIRIKYTRHNQICVHMMKL